MTKTLRYNSEPADRRPVVVAGVRTPWTKAGTEFARLSSADLGVHAVREALARAAIAPNDVDELIFGCVGPQAKEANVARVIALRAGLPDQMPAFTVHRNCASGFQAIEEAARRIALGEGSVYVVGGAESMSAYPLIFGKRMTAFFERMMKSRSAWRKLRTLLSFRPSMLAPRIAVLEGLTDPTCGMIMGLTAEKLANEFAISRSEQDRFALESHQKAVSAWNEGAFADEVTDVFLPAGRSVGTDNGPREKQSIEALGKLRPYFDRREGSVTVGNACPVTDGAAALIMMSAAEAERRGAKVLGRLVSSAVAGLDPTRMGLGPAYAMPAALDCAGVARDDVAVWEINEAFSAQVLACLKALESRAFCERELGRSEAFGAIDPSKLNPLGGAVALGHPVGATGARLVLTTLLQLGRQGGGHGIASACVGGGQGAAQLWETAA